jgi:hypothetical protein
MTWNQLHLARMLKDAGGIPAQREGPVGRSGVRPGGPGPWAGARPGGRGVRRVIVMFR